LALTDEKLVDFDTRFKVSPPLRSNFDRLALITGVIDGTIDMITSDHNPIDIEHKKMEFDFAKDGTIGLESAFGVLQNVLPLEIIIDKFTLNKNIFSIETSVIQENSIANFTLFNPNKNWSFSKENIISKSKNSAFIETEMKGKVYGIINQGQIILD
jgi:dihydroorotase